MYRGEKNSHLTIKNGQITQKTCTVEQKSGRAVESKKKNDWRKGFKSQSKNAFDSLLKPDWLNVK